MDRRLVMAVCMATTRTLVQTPMGPGLGMRNLTGVFLIQQCPSCKRFAGMNPYTGQWSRHGDCDIFTAEVLHEEHAH